MARRVSDYLKVPAFHLAVPRLESIRSRILALAVLGTLLPAALILGVAYFHSRGALEDRIEDELHGLSSQAARLISVEAQKQLQPLNIAAVSEAVWSSLDLFSSGRASIPPAALRNYIRSLHERLPEFQELLVLDAAGRVLVSSPQRSRAVALPADWQRALREEKQLITETAWDERMRSGRALAAVPVLSADGRFIGAVAGTISLNAIQALLQQVADDGNGSAVLLATDSGAVVGAAGASPMRPNRAIPRRAFRRLTAAGHATLAYDNQDGQHVIGTLDRVPQTPWLVIAERGTDASFAQIRAFRNLALLVIVLVLLVMALTAYRLGLLIVGPLERLAHGAAIVGTGDLEVDLPRTDRGEVGALTAVFNNMVARLREGREALARSNAALVSKNAELERLSVTDGLTGLMNHRALTQRLADEAVRSQRTERPFVFMMADVDHFKQYNDQFGHPAGDEVLKRVATILREATRDVDCAARYGGEEFALLLPETDGAGGLEVAERIRQHVAAAEFPGRKITLSIGLAEFPRDSADASALISLADQALYAAKQAGRNQVVTSRKARRQKLPAAPKKTTPKKKG